MCADLVRESGATEPGCLSEILAMPHEGAVIARNVAGVPEAALTASTPADTLLTAHGVPA